MAVGEVPADPGRAFDRDGELRRLAVLLLDAYRQDVSNALLAREARMTLLCLPGSKDRTADDELQLLMAELSRPVQADYPPGWPGQTGDDSG